MLQSAPRRLSALILVLCIGCLYPLVRIPANVGPVKSAARPVVVPTYPAVDFGPKVLNVEVDFQGFGFGFQPLVIPGSFGGRSSIYKTPQIRGRPGIVGQIAGYMGQTGSIQGFGGFQVFGGNIGPGGFAPFGSPNSNFGQFGKRGFSGNNGL